MTETISKIKLDLRSKQADFLLFMTILLLLGIGTMMVFSASSASSRIIRGNSYELLIKQLVFATLGIVLMIAFSFIDYRKLAKLTIPLYIGTVGVLILVLLVGITKNNAKRWLGAGTLSFQPSEVAKVTVVFLVSYVLSHPKYRDKARSLWGLLMYMLPVVVMMGLIYLQPHISCIMILGAVMVVMMFVGGVSFYNFALLGVCGVGVVALAFLKFAHVGRRIFAFLDPFSVASDEGYQVVQSLYAIGSGGLFGRGLGQSVQKYLYLPEPYNDFIFSILAEELGFFGVFIVLFLFGVFIWRGYKIAACANDLLGTLLATGITTIVAVQTIMNVAVVTSSMPATGISLPFFSYGGTSLLILMASMGILLNISKNSKYVKF